MSTAGDYVGEEVWHRIVQIVTNTEELQEYAARKVYEHLRNPTCHETIVKVGAYILGEFGHLVAAEDDPNAISPIEQFSLINSKISICSPATKALILTTYAKWLNLFPEIREHVLAVLARFTHALDAELQQRACEYISISKMPEEEILQVVLDEMPPFPESRESALLNRLMKKHVLGAAGGEKKTWTPGGKDVNKDLDEERYKGFGARRKAAPTAGQAKENGTTNGESHIGPTPEDAALIAMSGGGNGEGYVAPDDIMAGLAGLDLSSQVPLNGGSSVESPVTNTASTPGLIDTVTSPSTSAQAPLIANGSSESSRELPEASPSETTTPSIIDPAPAAPKAEIQFTHGADKWLSRLSYNSEGILYEDSQLQIGLKSEYHGHQGRIALFFGNKISVPFSSLTVTIESQEPEALSCNLQKIPPATLNAATQIQQVLQVECKAPFMECPVMNVSYLAGSMQTLTLKLPVWVNKFMETASLDTQAFFERWKAIGGAPREAQAIFPCRLAPDGNVDISRNKKVVKGLRFGVLDGVDPNPNNLVAASVFHTATGKVGCLMRLEPNSAAKVSVLPDKESRFEATA